MYIFAPQIIGTMTPVEEIRRLGVMALRIEAFAEPMFAAAIILIRRIRRGSQYPRPVIDELFQYLGRANLVGGVARSHHGPERRMGGHVCGIVFPWNHIPDPAEGKTVDENLTEALHDKNLTVSVIWVVTSVIRLPGNP